MSDDIARELLRLARSVLSQEGVKVLAPEGRRKSWKIVRPDGSVYYTKQKPSKKELAQPAGGKGKELAQPAEGNGEVSNKEVSDIRKLIKDEVGRLPKNIDKIIREEAQKVLSEGKGNGKVKDKGKKDDSGEEGLFTEEERSLPEDVSQPAKTEKDLYKSAQTAQKQMMQLLDQGQGLDKKLGLKHFDIAKGDKPDLDAEGPILITAAPKGKERAREKVEADYGGDWSRLQDVVRASVAVDSFDQVKDVIKELRDSGAKIATPPKDRFAKPTSAGYRDAMLKIKYPNGHIGELQVHVKSILKAKEAGHKEYEKVRSIEAKAAKEGRDTLTKDEQKEVDRANAAMKKLYDDAWGKAMKTASRSMTAKDEYYEMDGNPIMLKRMKFPYMWVKGEKTVFYDFWRLHHDANPISKSEFNRLMKKQGAKL